MMICTAYEAAFMTIPKNCTTTIFRILEDYYGPVIYDNKHPRKIPESYRHFFTFACVRNPYTRAVSVFRHNFLKLCKPEPMIENGYTPFIFKHFTQWCAGNINHPICENLMSLRTQHYQLMETRVDIRIHLEKVEEEFNALPFTTGNNSLENLNHPIDYNPLIYYDHATLLAVNKWYAEDFKMLPEYPMAKSIRELICLLS
jgi:hypothetical protein